MSDALGSGERHVESAWVVQEADALVLVGAHTRQHDEVLLASLEGVHARYLDLLHIVKAQIAKRYCSEWSKWLSDTSSLVPLRQQYKRHVKT